VNSEVQIHNFGDAQPKGIYTNVKD